MKISHLLIFYFIIILQPGLLAQTPSQVLDNLINTAAFQNAELGILVKNISSNEILISHRPDKLLSPASILKIHTVARAINTLGPDHRFETQVLLTGEIDEGVLYGDVIIKGKGDPSLGSNMSGAISTNEICRDLLAALEQRQVNCIHGAVMVDASYFSLPGVPAGYMQEDIANYYGAGAYGFNIQDNAYEIVLDRLKNKSVSIKTFDSLAIDFVTNDLEIKGYSDQAYAYHHPQGRGVHIIGTVPIGVGSFKIKGAIQNPPAYAAEKIYLQMESAGIQMQEKWKDYYFPIAIRGDVVYNKIYYSPTVQELLIPILHKSNNVYAEVFHRHVKKLEPHKVEGPKLQDGSGLSPANRISAHQLMDQLESIYKSQHFSNFIASMPQNGKDGTVRSILKNKPGKLYIKSGSIGGVRCYMGLKKKGVEWIGFVCMANELDTSATKSRQAWEILLEWVADL